MTNMPAGHYDRFDPAQNYEQHLFRSGKPVQGAELNEIQTALRHRMRSVSDVLFRDGDVIRDCVAIINPATGVTTCSSGAVYLQGMVRGVAPATFTIPVVGIVTIGLRLVESVVTELEDSGLLDPAQSLRNFGQAGAVRLKVVPVWGWDGDNGTGAFFPMFTVENGVQRVRQAPPQIDAVRQAIEKYDRDSSGGTYVVSGMECTALADAGGNQIYSVDSGSARVRGRGIDFIASRRLAFPPQPDVRFVDSEPHLSTGTAAQRVPFNLSPAQNVTKVSITAEKTETLTHGSITGSQDQIAQGSVLSIVEVKQGGTTYVQGADYQLTAGKVDWSPTGAEPATGSTYTVKFRYITDVAPTLVDATGCTVTGAVPGTPILVSYNQMLPRYDRICVDETGNLVLLKGVAANFNPVAPDVPDSLLGLATIYQTWTGPRILTNNAVRVVPMNELAQLNNRIDQALSLIAQQRLENSVTMRETGSVQGVFTDPFLDDSMRDNGFAQTAAIYWGTLSLPIQGDMFPCDSRPAGAASSLAFTLSGSFTVQQTLRTGSMLVNPYQAFTPLPAVVTLQPAVDRWVDFQTEWASPESRNVVSWQPLADPTMGGRLFNATFEWQRVSSTFTTVQTVGTRSETANLRQIEVRFSISGFGGGEALSSVTFDGVPVTASAI